MTSSSGKRLDPMRLFSDPPLTAAAPVDLKFVPKQNHIAYRAVATDNREHMDLWLMDLDTLEQRRWLSADDIAGDHTDATRLTAAERAERERRRQFTFGVTSHTWFSDGSHVLLPMNGQAYLVNFATARSRCLSFPDTRQSGFRLSPDDAFLSYVREGNLYVNTIVTGEERTITEDASDVVSNGLPDFLAAEEMHRFEGHWWLSDNRTLLYTRVDESSVPVSHRLEMQANGTSTVAQRYPYAGGANPQVSLHAYDIETSERTLIWSDDADAQVYLARVIPVTGGFVIQTQNRLQQVLETRLFTPPFEQGLHVHTESSNTWVNLHDDLLEIPDAANAAGPNPTFLTTHENAGTRGLAKLSLYRDAFLEEELIGPTHINQVLAADESNAYVMGWDHQPTENHLFAVDLHGEGCRRITASPGWHTVVMDMPTQRYIDSFTSTASPRQVDLCRLGYPSDDRVEEASLQQTLYTETIDNAHAYRPYLAQHQTATFGTVSAADGQRLHYRITPPLRMAAADTDYPTVLYVYGGPGAQKVRQEWSPLLLQLFAQQGFGVIEIDNRGSANRGRTFEAPIYTRMGHPEVEDQLIAFDILRELSWANTERVGVFGHSYGGYMTLMCLSQSARFKSGVAVAPVCDWQLYDTHYTERYMGLPDSNANSYANSNVLTHLPELTAPLLLMHGMADDNVLFTHSTMIMGRLQELGKSFELMTYPGAKHSMQERHVSIHRFNCILDFFKRTL